MLLTWSPGGWPVLQELLDSSSTRA